jgi:hypothetical protein
MFMQKVEDLREDTMLSFLNTAERSARFVVDMAGLLRVPDANLFAHRQQSQYSNAKSRLQGMPITSGRESILQFFGLLVVSRATKLPMIKCELPQRGQSTVAEANCISTPHSACFWQQTSIDSDDQ